MFSTDYADYSDFFPKEVVAERSKINLRNRRNLWMIVLSSLKSTGIKLPHKKGTNFLLSLFESKSNLLTSQSAGATARSVAFFPTALTK
jgi:hypothetical protein